VEKRRRKGVEEEEVEVKDKDEAVDLELARG